MLDDHCFWVITFESEFITILTFHDGEIKITASLEWLRLGLVEKLALSEFRNTIIYFIDLLNLTYN